MILDGVSLLIFAMLGAVILYSAFRLIRILQVMANMRSLNRKLDRMEAELEALSGDDYFGPRPW